MLIHLIRHGETDWNAARRVQGQMESQLSALGQDQARQLAVRLKNYQIQHVFCSSSHRTRQTAELLFKDSATEISFHDQLREIRLGPWEGCYYEDLASEQAEQYSYFWNQPHRFTLPGAETFHQLQERGVAALQEICANSTHNEVAIVSHGALIKSILCHFEKRPLARFWEPPKMHNCAHSLVEMDSAGNCVILRYADVDYNSPTAAS